MSGDGLAGSRSRAGRTVGGAGSRSPETPICGPRRPRPAALEHARVARRVVGFRSAAARRHDAASGGSGCDRRASRAGAGPRSGRAFGGAGSRSPETPICGPRRPRPAALGHARGARRVVGFRSAAARRHDAASGGSGCDRRAIRAGAGPRSGRAFGGAGNRSPETPICGPRRPRPAALGHARVARHVVGFRSAASCGRGVASRGSGCDRRAIRAGAGPRSGRTVDGAGSRQPRNAVQRISTPSTGCSRTRPRRASR